MSITQMWADDKGFYEVYMKYDKNGSESNYTYNGSNGSMDLGTITSSFKIKEIYLKVWDDWGDQAFEAGKSGLGYKTQSGSDTDYKTNTRSSESAHDYELQATSMNLTIASSTNPSGNYTFEHWWFAKGTYTDTYWLKNSSANCAFTYKILPPSVKSSSVTVSATNTAAGSGTGLSSESPIILISGMGSTLTITATQNHTDANSALWCKFASGSYSSTTTYAISSGTTQTNQTLALAVRYRNDDAKLDGAETTTTIYYKWAAPAPAISLTSVSPSSSIVAGNDITLVGTRANSSNAISFQYTTNDGSTWTDITPKTTSGDSPKTITWTVPDAHGTTQTFKFRAKLAEATPIYSSKSSGVSVYNTKTFKLKNEKSWSDLYLYAYNGSGDLIGSFPGIHSTSSNGFSINKITNSGLWWNVTITSECTHYIISKGSGGDGNQTTNVPYGTYSDGGSYGCYDTSTGLFYTRSGGSALSAPSVSTSSVTPTVNNAATIGGNVTGLGNDWVTSYGYYYSSTNSSLSGSNLTGATKVEVGTNKSATGTYSKSQTGLTGGTTYYVIAYATNGHSTVYGSRVSFTTPYKVTVSLSTGGSSISPSGVQYTTSSINLTAVRATGYTFNSWSKTKGDLSNAAVDGGTNTVTFTPTADEATITAIYDETMHTVTLNSTYGSGHVEIGGETVTSASAGIATASSTITAVPDLGYYFTGWTGDIGSGVTLASGTTSTASITIRATADSKSITANFAKRWAVAGEWKMDGVNWDHTTYTFYPNPAGWGRAQVSDLAANTEYAFKLYDNTGATHWVGYASSGQVYDYDTYRAVSPADSILVNTYSGNAITLKTAAKGNYSFYYNFNTHKLYVYFPQSRKISMGVYTKSDGTSSAHTGGTISAVDNDENVITDGLYVSNNGSVTFTASPKAGYIWRGWYSNAYCTGDPVATERTHTVSSITSDVTRYALFDEALYTVTVHRNEATETTAKVGVDSHPYITAATAPTGKVFDRWVTTGSATVADPYASRTTITSATDDVSTVTATFKDLPKIYIDMTSATGWTPTHMYVVFYKDGGYFDENKGTGTSSTYVINAIPLEMTKMGDSKVWYYSYDPTSGDFEDKTITCVTFIDHTYAANYGNFTSATAVYRTDFSSCMNMFVVTDNTGVDKNTSDYSKKCYYRNTNAVNSTEANKGYWRKYEEKNSGFYLNNLPGGSVEFTNEDGGNTYTAIANLDANTTYYFYLGECNGWNWSNDQTTLPFNSDNRTRMVQPYGDVSKDGLRCKLTTTAAGYYTFSITPQRTRQVQVSVDFPVAANDYRAVYNNAASSPTVSRPSNFIKNDQNSGTISLWLNKGTNYISFQKATVAAGGAVTWGACGAQQTVTGVPEAGIYNMTLTRNNTTYTVSTPEKYEGDLFIRTDCAPGKWGDYTENKLDKNTFNFNEEDANSYDYYYCKWINDAGTNVRCVIANDINVALSDTLKGEAILGGRETLPEGANVRFSYNSLTNTLKRSYLTGSHTNVFLNIMPDAASTVYQTDGSTDMYNGGVVGARNKFTDLGNWVYELDVKAYPNATASVQANYNSTQQSLIASGTKLIGGTEEVLQQIRLIYDFRTNYLMSAWMPNGEDVDEPISLNSDMMILRKGQGDANQLSFSGTGKLDDVKRAYGVFEFRKSEMVGRMNTWSDYGYSYSLCMYYFSLPFDVNVKDIFGVGTMGDDWRIRFYNGKKRAEKGWFEADGITTFWEDLKPDTVLHAYEGYCLMLNRSHFNNGSHAVWKNIITSAFLYFPSAEPVSALKDNEMPITVPSHECTIDRFFVQDSLAYYDKETKTWKKGARNHKYTDSHWNMIGTPLFEDKEANSLTACSVKVGDADSTLNYIYEWIPSTNSLSPARVLNTGFEFKSMYGYMVQYSGTVTFEGASITPASIAARHARENKQHTIELELTKEGMFASRTYVELRENADDDFQLNEDMYMMKSSNIADIYTHAGGYEVAANVLSVSDHIVPVSVDTKSASTYVISMPKGFDGEVVLVDNYAQTRTNLNMEDYEIALPKGSITDRFYLEINIKRVPTAIDGVEDGSGTLKDGKAHKYIENDKMYILRNGVIYDAQGKRVK